VFLHVKGMNGPGYFPWEWRRLSPGRSFAWMLLAAIPFFVGQYLYFRAPRLVRTALLLVAMSTFSLELVCAGLQSSPFSLRRISDVVESVQATSYFTIAASLCEGADARPLREWLREYWTLMPRFPGHGANKPPGPVLYYCFMTTRVGGHSTAALLGGLIVGLLAAAGVPLTFVMLRHLLGDPVAAFHGASFFGLCPGLIGFFPQWDQIYPLFTCGLVLFWSLALTTRAPLRNAVGFGVVLSLALMWSYSLLVLGLFLAGYTILIATQGGGLDRIVRRMSACAGTGLAAVVVIYGLLWFLSGFDPIATFTTALHNQSRNLRLLARPYPRTIPWDLFDFALGTGWISVLLVGFAIDRARSAEIGRRERWLIVLVLAQIGAVAVTGLLQTETARVWLFMAPLLMIPVGVELQHWKRSHVLAAYAGLWLVTSAIVQNMVFIGL
jgi:hypothetical protein